MAETMAEGLASTKAQGMGAWDEALGSGWRIGHEVGIQDFAEIEMGGHFGAHGIVENGFFHTSEGGVQDAVALAEIVE